MDELDCTYSVVWSRADKAFVATVKEFPSLSWLSDSASDARARLMAVVADTIKDIEEGELGGSSVSA